MRKLTKINRRAQQFKESAMAANDKRDASGIRSERAYPTKSHRLLGMTHDELLADMACRGQTKQGALAIFGRIEQALRAPSNPLASALGSAPKPDLVAGRLAPSVMPALPFYDERVSAGRGEHADGAAQFRPASLSDLFGKQDWGALVVARVSGSSMIGERIQDGDAVLVDTRRQARDGDIVLAHLAGHGQMVKRLRREGALRVVLDSANPAFGPIEIDDPGTLTIHGVVVARSGAL